MKPHKLTWNPKNLLVSIDVSPFPRRHFQILQPFVFETVVLSTPLLVLFHLQHFIGKTPLATRETQCLRIHHVRTMSGSGGRRHQMNQDNEKSQGTAEDKNIYSTQWHSAKQHQGTKNKKKKRRRCEIDWILICLCFIILLLFPNILRIAHKFVRTNHRQEHGSA